MLASVNVLSAFFLTPFANPGKVERKRQAVGPFTHDRLSTHAVETHLPVQAHPLLLR